MNPKPKLLNACQQKPPMEPVLAYIDLPFMKELEKDTKEGFEEIKDEIKKDNLIFIPSGRFDIGHTILSAYKEVGNGAIDVEKQHVRSKKIRVGLAAVEDLSNDRYNIKRHGKIEYVTDIDRSSNFKYSYIGWNWRWFATS